MTISVTSTSTAQAGVLDLGGRKGLVVGIANEHNLAWLAAQHFRSAGAELAVTYLNAKAKPFVEPLASSLAAPISLAEVCSSPRAQRTRKPSEMNAGRKRLGEAP